MNHYQAPQFHQNKTNFNENSAFKKDHSHRNIPKTAPQKTRNEVRIVSTDVFDISEEDFLGSMLTFDVQPICHPKRISKTPIIGKRKRKIYDQNITPIQKIDTQKLHSPQVSKRASTTTSVIRPVRNDTSLSNTGSHMFIPNFAQTQKSYKIQIPESQSSNLVDPLKITQIDTVSIPKKSSKTGQFSLTYGSVTSTRKIFQKPHSSCTNRSKSPKKKISTSHTNTDTSNKPESENKNDTQLSIENKFSFAEPQLKENNSEKVTKSVKFDKKSFLKKLDNIDQDIRVKSTIAFTNGRVLPSLHFQKEPDRYVIACAIHIEFSFNFFTFATNPIIEKYLIIDEESYDLFDSNFENSNRLSQSSKYFRIQKEILSKNSLNSFMLSTPSLTRRDIEKQHFFQKMKIFPSFQSKSKAPSLTTFSEEIQKKYPNNLTTDDASPLIAQRMDCSEMPNGVVVCDENDDDEFNFDLKSCCCNLSNLKSLSSLL